MEPHETLPFYQVSLRKVELDEEIWATRHVSAVNFARPDNQPLSSLSRSYEKIFNHIPVEIVVFDVDHRFLYINPKAIKDPDLRKWLIGKDDFDYCHYVQRNTQLAENRWKLFEQAVQSHTAVQWEEHAEGLHSQAIITNWTLTPVCNQAGKVEILIATGNDITAIKNAQQQIREHQDKFMLLANNVKEAFFIRNAEMNKFIYVSPAFEQIWGYPAQQLLDDPKTWYYPVHPEDKSVMKNLHVTNISREEARVDFRIIRPDGVIRWLEARQFPVHDAQGKFSHIVGVAEDITDRKIAELALKNSAREFRDIFENAPIPMAISTVDGKLVMVNDAMVHTMGYSKGEFLEKTLSIISCPEDLEANRLGQQKLLTGELESFRMDKRYLHKDGHIIHCLLKSSLIRDALGRPTHFLGQLVDITDLKNAEETLTKRNEELAKINSELDRFVYSASHDLRAPLTSLLGIINLLELESPADTISSYLRMMRTSINRMDSFIKEIIDYSRNSRTEVNREAVNLEELIQECYEDLIYLPGSSRISREVHLKIAEVYTDKRRIKTVLSNLIANAIIYHSPYREKPYVRVEVEKIAQQYVISVTDNGKGIGEEHQAKVFNMFYRASDDTKGSGLGLYIVKEALDKLEGQIRLQSQLGEGTIFTITLPALQ